MMKRIRFLLVLAFLAGMMTIPALAQSGGDVLPLDLSRDFGYGGGVEIQGLFSMKVDDAAGIDKVDFYVDDTLVCSLTEQPFVCKFDTSQFPVGEHSMYAVGTKKDGTQVESVKIVREFISGKESFSKVMRIFIPVMLAVFALSIAGVLIPVLTGKKHVYPAGEYGPGGGAVCPKCGLPFARALFGINMLVGKLQRCPHCGGWVIARRASPQALLDAEKRLAESGKIDADALDEPDSFQEMLDQSRFEDDS